MRAKKRPESTPRRSRPGKSAGKSTLTHGQRSFFPPGISPDRTGKSLPVSISPPWSLHPRQVETNRPSAVKESFPPDGTKSTTVPKKTPSRASKNGKSSNNKFLRASDHSVASGDEAVEEWPAALGWRPRPIRPAGPNRGRSGLLKTGNSQSTGPGTRRPRARERAGSHGLLRRPPLRLPGSPRRSRLSRKADQPTQRWLRRLEAARPGARRRVVKESKKNGTGGGWSRWERRKLCVRSLDHSPTVIGSQTAVQEKVLSFKCLLHRD